MYNGGISCHDMLTNSMAVLANRRVGITKSKKGFCTLPLSVVLLIHAHHLLYAANGFQVVVIM